MGLFSKKRGGLSGVDAAALAQRSLDFIAEGVLVINRKGVIIFANPAAAAMTGYNTAESITGLDFQLVIRLEDHQENPIEPDQSALYTAIFTNQPLQTRNYVMVSAQSERRYSIDLSCIPTGDEFADRLVTFRDITTELAEEREQAEFISTASHEMRTPVASMEGYLGLALNPQTATIDDRARQYLEAAHAASQHLGHLFKDLLDVTKFDDSRANAHFIPVDAVQAVAYIANEQAEAMEAKHLRYTFGGSKFLDKKQLTQKIYMAVDYDFLREIVTNLVGNAVKYTPEGGSIKVSVKGEADKVLITVTDNGIGIPADDIGHVFQKFYRVDNTQTREIGGTGLGLYLVKQRVEAMNGRVWVESDFGHGSSFFVTLPRISESEYERMRVAYGNEKMARTPFVAPVVGTVDANIKVPSAGVEATATGQTGATIKQGSSISMHNTANSEATSAAPVASTPETSAALATAPANPTADQPISTHPKIILSPTSAPAAAEPASSTETTTAATVPTADATKPAASSLIKTTHTVSMPEDSATPAEPTPAATEETPMFGGKGRTLMPKTPQATPAPTAPTAQPEPPSAPRPTTPAAPAAPTVQPQNQPISADPIAPAPQLQISPTPSIQPQVQPSLTAQPVLPNLPPTPPSTTPTINQ